MLNVAKLLSVAKITLQAAGATAIAVSIIKNAKK